MPSLLRISSGGRRGGGWAGCVCVGQCVSLQPQLGEWLVLVLAFRESYFLPSWALLRLDLYSHHGFCVAESSDSRSNGGEDKGGWFLWKE